MTDRVDIQLDLKYPEISVYNFDDQQIQIKFPNGIYLRFATFSDYEIFAKMVYSNYRKYKYTFEKVKK